MSTTDDLVLRLERIDGRQEALRRRLEDGYGRIEVALADGQDVTQWETFWVDLLHQYEALCDDRLYEAA